MQSITSLPLLFTRKQIRLLLLILLACTITSACSSDDDSSGGDTNSVLPSPYANGFRVVQVITTFSGDPWSVEDYVYSEDNSTILLNRVQGVSTFSDIQLLNSAGLIVRSGKPDENNSLSEESTTWEYSYNENGQLLSEIDLGGFARGRYIRDAQGNITEKRSSNSSVEYTYGANGELETIRDTQATELFVIEYNAAGLLSGGTSSFDTGEVRGRFEVMYDENGNLSQFTNYVGFDDPIFSVSYVYEETDEIIVNHSLMRLLNELPDLISPPY